MRHEMKASPGFPSEPRKIQQLLSLFSILLLLLGACLLLPNRNSLIISLTLLFIIIGSGNAWMSFHSLLYNIGNDAVLDPLHGIRGGIQTEYGQHYPSAGVYTKLGA